MKKILVMLLCGVLIISVGFVNKSIIKDEAGSVTLSKINNNVWVHTTYGMYNGVNTPANGLVVLTNKGIVLIDTPWTNEETEALIKLTKKEFNKNVVLAVITHAHQDRIGGIDTLLKHKIKVESTRLTAYLAAQNGYKKPQAVLNSNSVLNIGDTKLETYYPGEGHTADNIVVWISDYKILFGGCLIKAQEATSIGNTNDANILEWPKSVKKVIEKYPNAKIVIPGHGNWGDMKLMKHTLELLGKNH